MTASNQTLILECWTDELSPVQMAAFEKAKSDQAAITEKLSDLMKNQSGEELYIGEIFSAYQFQGKVQTIDDTYIVKIPTKYKNQQTKHKNSSNTVNHNHSSSNTNDHPPTTRTLKRKAALAASNATLDDDEDDVPLTKRTATRKDKDYNPSSSKGSKHAVSSTTPQAKEKKGKSSKSAEKDKDKEKVTTPFRPSEITSIGGLTIDLNKDDAGNKSGDAKDASKLQGKTFPSLVVLAKPFLKVKEQTGTERSALDSKVKVVLMLTPSKFTEWLIQQGLLKSEQKCALHPVQELKLGVYSDVTKFPYSGGYVWISECCPTRFISVFHGSIFEGAPHPPSCILKLIYHWACQTNIQNVVQWVKVDNLYIKGVYTWLRAICTLALNKHLGLMGGPGKYVEVGVISLGTTAQDGQQRQVKVEVLGVLDVQEKIVRLRAIEPFTDNDRSYKRRFAKILEPLTDWVSKESTITIDLTVDKTTLNSMGYKSVLQAAANDTNSKYSNATIMDYLRRIVPRMFQNTLSLLSRQMIQQFLDELVWREQFGTYPLQAFDSITTHLAEQTRIDTKDTLTQRLYQVATNPFKNWTNFEMNTPVSKEGSRRSSKKSSGKSASQQASDVVAKATKISLPIIKKELSSSSPSSSSHQHHHKKSETKNSNTTVNTITTTSTEKSIETNGLEEIYYGILPENENFLYNIEKNIDYKLDLKCPNCTGIFKTNSLLQADILKHIDIDTNREDYKHQCVFCLEKLPSERGLRRHESLMHPSLTKHSGSVSYHCLICQARFNSIQLLSAHLQRFHVMLELPYICHACGYRTSCHYNIIEHFYKNHDNENMLQCPLCLAVYWIFSKGEIIEENIKQYFIHMQRHFEKASNKKCNKCVLTFITKGDLKYHLLKDHYSFSVNKKVCKLTDSTIKIPIPKYRGCTSKITPTYKVLEEYPSLVINLNGGKLCLECDRDLDEGIHISGFYKCQKCEYKTCCLRAMFEHSSSSCTSSASNNNTDISVYNPLEKEMHCVCGYSCSEGNSMAKHLVICDHKSAYPTVESAQENTVKRNMLDMLGLVRREGEDEETKNTTDNNFAADEQSTTTTTTTTTPTPTTTTKTVATTEEPASNDNDNDNYNIDEDNVEMAQNNDDGDNKSQQEICDDGEKRQQEDINMEEEEEEEEEEQQQNNEQEQNVEDGGREPLIRDTEQQQEHQQ